MDLSILSPGSTLIMARHRVRSIHGAVDEVVMTTRKIVTLEGLAYLDLPDWTLGSISAYAACRLSGSRP